MILSLSEEKFICWSIGKFSLRPADGPISVNRRVVVGETTGVQGIGRDPIVISLPESGLLLRYPYCNGINADGTFNGEVGVRPDIEIHGKDKNERLQNLIEYLSAL